MRSFFIVLCAAAGIAVSGAQGFAQEGYIQASCEQECSFLTKDCQAYVECRVAKGTCLENCMQRKVWEKVSTSLDKLSDVLEAQAREHKAEKETSTTLKSAPVIPAPAAPEQPMGTASNQTMQSGPGQW